MPTSPRTILRMRAALGPRTAIATGGSLALLAGAVASPSRALAAASQAWPPFVLVVGLLLIGYVAAGEGLFERLAAQLGRLPGGPLVLYGAAMSTVAMVTVVLNLDTSVTFLTPILVHTARRRHAEEAWFLYGCVLVSNATSLLLPGSNLTNLLVLSSAHVSGADFAARTLLPWLAAGIVTAVAVPALLGRHRSTPVRPPETASLARLAVSPVAIILAIAAILALSNPALLVVAIGMLATAAHLTTRDRRWRSLGGAIDGPIIAGLFGIAVGLGTLARVWSGPGILLSTASGPETALLGAAGAVFLNNLPAAVLLSARAPAHPLSLLIGLDIGPNLAVTGSLSAVLWFQAARTVGAAAHARTYTLVGLVATPLAVAAALLALTLSPSN